MNTNVQDNANPSDETMVSGQLKILRPGKITHVLNPDPFAPEDGESVGFDPYDTASLYVEKSSDLT